MVERQLYELHASICQTLANPKRLEVISLLRDGEKSVTELTEAMQIGQANLSQHLGLMRQKGIVVARREGLNIYYRLSNSKIIQACDLMRQVLLENLKTGAVLVEAART
ncbi:MAG: transcriptional regulator [Chloroflexi bacterium RBG_13_60_9]|nr:MAG: transcriptional regulator [Chloroflexi bacterium RBG_13_60_9]